MPRKKRSCDKIENFLQQVKQGPCYITFAQYAIEIYIFTYEKYQNYHFRVVSYSEFI